MEPVVSCLLIGTRGKTLVPSFRILEGCFMGMSYMDVVRLNDNEVDELLAEHVFVQGVGDLDIGQRRRLLGKHVINKSERVREQYSLVPDGPRGEGWNWCVYENTVGYRTGSGNEMSLLVQLYDLDRSEVPLMTEWEQVTACDHNGTVCKGSSGGCPGYAPRFDKIARREQKFTVLIVTSDMSWSLMYACMMIPSWKNYLTWTDRITSSYVVRILRDAFAEYRTLGLGTCSGKCKPCAVLQGLKCVKPGKRSYSMEAVGVDCDALHMLFYGEPLPWSYRGHKKMQTYMSRYAGVFADANDLDGLIDNAVSNDKSFFDPAPQEPDFPVELMTIQSGVYKGEQYVYDVIKLAWKKGM